jgi:ketosteroid isomerase-like protein
MYKYQKNYDWFTNLNRASLDSIHLYYDSNAFFKDPFNEIYGSDLIKKLFLDMYDHLQDPRFVFYDIVESGEQSFVVWDFIFSIKGNEYKIHGTTHLKFNQNGFITYHRDYWDVGEELLTKIPVLKYMYNFFRKKLSISKD